MIIPAVVYLLGRQGDKVPDRVPGSRGRNNPPLPVQKSDAEHIANPDQSARGFGVGRRKFQAPAGVPRQARHRLYVKIDQGVLKILVGREMYGLELGVVHDRVMGRPTFGQEIARSASRERQRRAHAAIAEERVFDGLVRDIG